MSSYQKIKCLLTGVPGNSDIMDTYQKVESPNSRDVAIKTVIWSSLSGASRSWRTLWCPGVSPSWDVAVEQTYFCMIRSLFIVCLCNSKSLWRAIGQDFYSDFWVQCQLASFLRNIFQGFTWAADLRKSVQKKKKKKRQKQDSLTKQTISDWYIHGHFKKCYTTFRARQVSLVS